jgi:Protein of unknown function (DUF3747)
MHISLNLRSLALATVVLCGSATGAIAAPLFNQQEIDQSKFVLAASPYGGNAHQLLVIEQLNNRRQCWSESGASPTLVNPLLAEFDFTDICGRSIDSNGYSIRTANEDLNWRYSLRAVRRGNDILLLGIPNSDRTAPELLIGRTRGYTSGFAKFYLEPGWRLTKRSYNGTSTGHLYLTNNQTLASLNAAAIAARPVPVVRPPIVTRPTPPIAVINPAPVAVPPVASQPRPAPNRRLTWWQRLFGDRSANPTPRAATPSSPTTPLNPLPTNTSGDVVVPIVINQP